MMSLDAAVRKNPEAIATGPDSNQVVQRPPLVPLLLPPSIYPITTHERNQMDHTTQITKLPGRRNRLLPFLTGPPTAAVKHPPRVLPQAMATTMIYADAAGCSTLIDSELSRLGRHSVLVHHPLEAMAVLQNARMVVDAAFVSLQDVGIDIASFFTFLNDEHPAVRRIAFAQHGAKDVNTTAVQTCQQDMILWDPWDRDSFSEILEDALHRRLHRTESSWSDLQLFRSHEGVDRPAMGAILGRYKHRIMSLAADATRNAADAEDIVQDTYMEIMQRLPSFDGSCSPGHWIDRMARRCIRSYVRHASIGNVFHRRASNRSACERPLIRQDLYAH